MSPAARPADVRAGNLDYRPVRIDEIEACARVWRTAINDYTGRLGQPGMPDDLAPIIRLYHHLRSTDPERFVVATEPDTGRVVGFASAVVRDRLWYLSMLFVLPDRQAGGVGRRLLDEVRPGPGVEFRATATDSAQPIANGLYASIGIVPRLPLLRLVGRAERVDELPPLPAGIVAVPFDEIEAAHLLGAEIDALDRSVLGFEHPVDHAFVRSEGRRGFLYRTRDGAPVGYGHAAESGRVGPIAVRGADLLAPVLAHVVRAVEPRGAFAVWLPGSAGSAVPALLRSGFRFDSFPVLVCWDRPFADFSRYVPISPGLL